MSSGKYKRVNVLISNEQYDLVSEMGLNLSGLIRDLLDDRFSDTSISLNVAKETKDLYELVISNFGSEDSDLEPYLLESLDKFLSNKTREIDSLRKKLKKK